MMNDEIRIWGAVLALTLSTLASAAIEPLPFESELEERRFQALAEELRCTVCQNQSLIDSDAPLARDLRQVLFTQLRDGRSDQEIRQFMVDRYGDFVLYRPPMKGHTVLLWFGPVVLLLGSLAGVAVIIRRRRRVLAAAARDRTPPAQPESASGGGE